MSTAVAEKTEIITELMTIKQETALSAFSKPDGVDQIIKDAEKQAEELVLKADLSTDKGRKSIASNARKFATLKTKLDEVGKGSTEAYRKTITAVNANRKKVKTRLDELRDQVRQPLTDWENKEKERIEKHESMLTTIATLGLSSILDKPLSLDEMISNKNDLEKIEINSSFEEFEINARRTHETALNNITESIAKETKRIEEEKELELLRKEKAEREESERLEKIKREAAEKATREAEEKAKQLKAEEAEKTRLLIIEKQEAEQRENDLKIEAENHEKQRLEDAKKAELDKQKAIENAKIQEQKRLAEAEENARLEQEKLEANKAHTSKILGEAKESIMKFTDEKTAKLIVKAIAKGEIKNVSINY